MPSHSLYHFKGRWVYLVVLAMIFQLMTGTGISAQTTDEMMVGGMKVEFTKVSIKENADTEEEIGSSEKPIISGTTQVASYEMKLSNCTQLSTESAIQVVLPEPFKLIQDETIPLKVKTDKGDIIVVGSCQFTAEDGVGTIKFNDELKKYTDAVLGFAVGVRAEVSLKPGESGSRRVEFKVGTQTIGLDLEFKGDNQPEETETPPEISKTHEKLDEATGNVCWIVTVKAGNKGLKDAVVEDSFKSDELMLKGIEKDNMTYTDYTSSSNGKTTLKINVPQLGPDEDCAFYITTEISSQVYAKEDAWKQIQNTASLRDKEGNKIIEQDKTDSISFTVNWIAKSAETYQKVDNGINIKVIKWKVVINANKRNISGYKFTDYMPKGTELINDSVKLNGTAIGNVGVGDYAYDESKEGTLPYKNKNGEDKTLEYKGILTYKFKDNLSNADSHKTYTFTYETKVTGSLDQTENKGEYCNYAEFAGLGTGEGIDKYYDYVGAGIQVADITKAAGRYDSKTHQIPWTILVNRTNNTLKAIEVTDTLPEGLKLADKAPVKVDGVNISSEDVTTLKDGAEASYKYDAGTRQLVCTISNEKTTNRTYEIKINTEVADKAVYANNLAENKTYTNTVKAAYISADGKRNETAPVTANCSVSSTVLKKESGGYDYKNSQATWLIVVNQNKMHMSNVVITDTLGEGQQYIPGSIKILKGDYSKKQNEVSNKENEMPDASVETAGSIVTIKLGDLSDTYTIVLTAKVDTKTVFKPGQQAAITNTAAISSPDLYDKIEPSKAENELSNSFILKNGQQAEKDGPIEWQIIINPNKVAITDVVVTDVLCSGLKLNTDSIALYKVDVSADGKIDETNKEEITLPVKNISYNGETNTCEFKIGDISDAYLLTFKTMVTDIKDGQVYTNTASIKGATLEAWQEESQKVEVKTQFSSSWGNVTVRTGTLKLVKVDEATNQPLKDAEFALSDGKVTLTATTDEKGVAIFRDLTLNKQYTLLENKAPIGYYQLRDAIDTIKLTDTTVKEMTIKNTLIKKGIQFKKVDNHDSPLEGAVFSLYSSTDKNKSWQAASDKDGLVTFAEIPIGTYLLKETKAPTGYICCEDVYTVEIKAEGPASIVLNGDNSTTQVAQIKNEKIKGSIKVVKVGESNQSLQGAEISLLNGSKEVLQTVVTDKDGTAYFNNVPYGTYYIKESKAPEGYILDESLKEMAVTTSQQLSMTLINKKTTSDDDHDSHDHDHHHDGNTVVIHEKDDTGDKHDETTGNEDNTSPSSAQTTGADTAVIDNQNPSNTGNSESKDYAGTISSTASDRDYTADGEMLPKTGQTASMELRILLGALLLGLGSGVSFYRRRKETH